MFENVKSSIGQITSAPIISHKNRYIYVYLPKVACTTIREMLAQFDGIQWYPNWTIKNGRLMTTKFERVPIGKINDFKQYFKFMVVRNPWDRLVSCYMDKVVSVRSMKNFMFVNNGEFVDFKRDYPLDFKNMSFDDFARFVSEVRDKNSNGHFRSQYTFIQKDNIKKLDFVGKIENLSKDLNVIKNRLGIRYQHKHLYKSKGKKPYQEYYSSETKELIRRRYGADIELFKYTFEGGTK